MQCNRWTLSRLNGLSRFWTNAPASVSSTISVNTTKNGFRTSALRHAKQMPPRPKLDENEIEEAFLKGTGPGGQKIVRHPINHSPIGNCSLWEEIPGEKAIIFEFVSIRM